MIPCPKLNTAGHSSSSYQSTKTCFSNSLETQVQPFTLVTPDNETIYAWHAIPLHLCREHEQELSENPPSGPASDYTQTSAFKLLVSNPNSRVVIQC